MSSYFIAIQMMTVVPDKLRLSLALWMTDRFELASPGVKHFGQMPRRLSSVHFLAPFYRDSQDGEV